MVAEDSPCAAPIDSSKSSSSSASTLSTRCLAGSGTQSVNVRLVVVTEWLLMMTLIGYYVEWTMAGAG